MIWIWIRGKNLLKNKSSHHRSKPKRLHPSYWHDPNTTCFTQNRACMRKIDTFVYFIKQEKFWVQGSLECSLGIYTTKSTKRIFLRIFVEYSLEYCRIFPHVAQSGCEKCWHVIGQRNLGGPIKGWHMASPEATTSPLKGQVKMIWQVNRVETATSPTQSPSFTAIPQLCYLIKMGHIFHLN